MKQKACKKILEILLIGSLAAVLFAVSSGRPAYAQVNPTWEESGDAVQVIEENSSGTESAFSTSGNGQLGDVIYSSSEKDFYTIQTKNNNTFYLVIDHSGSVDNVYMLSQIDEDDLAEFLSEEEAEEAAIVLEESTKQNATAESDAGAGASEADAGGDTTAEGASSNGATIEGTDEKADAQDAGTFNLTTIGIVAAVIAVGAGVYFGKFRKKDKPRKVKSENLERGEN